MALYPTDANYAETLRSFLDVCQILTPATLIAVSFGALSVLELFCMVANNDRKTIVGMILWSLLTILMNSFLAYFISTGYRLSIGIWTILITTSIVSVIWYISMIILLNGSKYIQKLAWKFEEKIQDEKEDESDLDSVGTKGLAYKLLREIGCCPQESEDGRILFEYQGIRLLMEVINECMFVNLIWPWCYTFSKYDIDEFARVRQVVNEINMHGTVSVFFSMSESDDVAVHIKKHFLFVQQIPDLENYLRLILKSFFKTARKLDLEIEKKRSQECGRSL